jgi:hypothetical protein
MSNRFGADDASAEEAEEEEELLGISEQVWPARGVGAVPSSCG